MDLIIKSLIALLPVLIFVSVLWHLDSHKLIGFHLIFWTIVAGGLLTIISYFANTFAQEVFSLDRTNLTRYGAPVIEELMKALVLVYLFRKNHIGFMVDAAILGFAVGAGFSLAENLFYLFTHFDSHYGVWTIRGLGTAIMHGGATAIFAIIAQELTERHTKVNPLLYLPGLIAAMILHSIFNHFQDIPILATVVTLLILPTLFFLLIEKNEVTIHNWLEYDFTAHKRLLSQIEGGEFTECEAGRFLVDLRKIFDKPVVDHMVEYIKIHTELIIDAEHILLVREETVDVAIGDDIRDKISTLHDLEMRIGRTAFHAMQPHLHFTRKELWELYMIEDQASHDGVHTII